MINSYTCQEKLDKLLSTRYINGADYWASPDGRLGIDKPISTLTAMLVMSELEVSSSHEALAGSARLVMSAVQSDGRFRISPKDSIYPCHTAIGAAALCRNGYGETVEAKRMLENLSSNRHNDGGWRCKKFFYGRGPETEYSNPGVTLFALDALRFNRSNRTSQQFDDAVETLLEHWVTREPMGPCHFGIGRQFMQLEFPFYRYNLFYYVYVLSFYKKAIRDERFNDAFKALETKLDEKGRLPIEKTKLQLQKLGIFTSREIFEGVSNRYLEIVDNIESI